MKRITTSIILTCLFFLVQWDSVYANPELIPHRESLFQGNAPSIAAEDLMVYMVFAKGDSILFSYSADKGITFSDVVTIAKISKLSTGGGRGPKIVIARNKLLVAAPDAEGNIHTFLKDKSATEWQKGNQVNDADGVVPEGFVALSSNIKGDVYAVWLDTRGNKKNKIVGAKSQDGGKTWSANKLIYESPESTVCECCKPSVIMDNQRVVVMFRNFLNGKRDMYLIQSFNGGDDFSSANKLGTGSWNLNACPMDGGGLIFGEMGAIETIWRRESNIYLCMAGKEEELVGTGKQCIIAGKDGKHFIAYVTDGNVYCQLPNKEIIDLGKGSRPELSFIDSASVFCVWEDKGYLYSRLVTQ